jgi:hypothetical protein
MAESLLAVAQDTWHFMQFHLSLGLLIVLLFTITRAFPWLCLNFMALARSSRVSMGSGFRQ